MAKDLISDDGMKVACLVNEDGSGDRPSHHTLVLKCGVRGQDTWDLVSILF